MGWATGSQLCEDICELVREYLSTENYKEVSGKICKMFVDMDGDDFECYPGTPYWNYLSMYDQDEFLVMLKEQVECESRTIEEVRGLLRDFKYEGFNVILIRWLEEDVRGIKSPSFTSDDYIDEIYDELERDAERQAEWDEERLWNSEF